ncbi:MFS-type efflux pump MSMEG_3705-like isoform X2 [Watersipora subatra]|uniref:MFS-type efflux pump MSMEG_3705-like isoform X2 n=1 Tax=Watersipora subatra TaxID=2589382 RepID=UPI00355C2F24
MVSGTFLQSLTLYKVYVLTLTFLVYLLNQLDRYLLPIMTQPMAQDIHYGDKGCLNDVDYFNDSITATKLCTSINSEQKCNDQNYFGGNQSVCMWDYTGQGLAYQIIAGPVFIIIYTVCGVFIGYLTAIFKKKNLLGFFLLLWSAFTALSGASTEYWQLALTRFGLGIGEAGCTPFASVIIADMFVPELRAMAMAIYSSGIYFGYSLAYAFGNFLYAADIMGQGWRWVFYISGLLGLPVAVLLFCTVRESRGMAEQYDYDEGNTTLTDSDQKWDDKLKDVIITFLSPPLLMLCLAGSIRNAGGYVWAVNTELFFESEGHSSTEIGSYMSWIPLVGGSLGALLGGFISDRVVRQGGLAARLAVLAVSQVCAAPFGLLALFLPSPGCYLILILMYIIGESSTGVCLTCVLELVPERIRGAAIGYCLFIVGNVSGNAPLLLSPLASAFAKFDPSTAFRNALIVLFPGMYITSAAIFLLTICVHNSWTKQAARRKLQTG